MADIKKIVEVEDHILTHSMAHYLLAIHKLKEDRGYARVTDVAKELGLTKGSVSTALANLKKKEMILEDESKFFSLSTEGHAIVHGILSARTLLFYFFKDFIGVSQEVAQRDSCEMEHLLSSETREKFFAFMKNISSPKGKIKNIKTEIDLSQFKNLEDFYCAQKGDSYLSV